MGEETIFSHTVFSNGIEKCARLWADDNFWPSSCQWGKAKRGQKAFSQLQTSAWCRRHQSAATDTSSERAGGKRQGDGGLSLCLSQPPLMPTLPRPHLLLQPQPAVSGSMPRHCTLVKHTHTHTYWTARARGERRGREIERCDVVTVEWLVYTQSLEEE